MLKKLIVLLLAILSYSSYSQNTSQKYEISRGALTLIKKDLQICDSLRVAYDIQTRDFSLLIDKNISLFNKISQANNKADLQQKQITKQEAEISKLLRRKNNAPLWIGSGVIVGLIGGALLAN